MYWDLKLAQGEESGMGEILHAQRQEANQSFCKYVERNYVEWLNNPDEDTPILSHTLLEKKLIPELSESPTFLIVLDCLRYDQWRTLQSEFSKHFLIEEDECYFSILPTATQFARNALFAGLMPSEIQRQFPQYWIDEDEEEKKNDHEEELLRAV